MSKKKQKEAKGKKKRVSISTIILFVVLLVGLGVMLYPTFSDWWNSMHASQAIAAYSDVIKDLGQEEREKMLEDARAYNKTLQAGSTYMLSDEQYAEYEKQLDPTGTGMMGYIQIPSINVNLPIYHGTEEAVLQIASGHLAGSSLPVGGETTHAVLSGHRGLPSAKLFTDLDELAEDDIFMITVLGETLTYMVDQIRIVLPEEVDDLAIVSGEDYVTLVTCTPYGVNTHRILVRGHRIENLPEELVVLSEVVRIPTYIVIFAVGVPLLFIMLMIMLIYYRIRRPKKTHRELLDELKKPR